MQKSEENLFFSCPGKILLVGGYSILYDNIPGITLAVDSKYYVHSEILENKENKNFIIKIFSRQIQMEWEYLLIEEENGKLKMELKKGKENVFLASILQVFFTFLKNNQSEIRVERRIVKVFIYSDKFFYSRKSLLDESEAIPYFDPENLKKTGLGSSACLIVSCLKSLLFSFLKMDSDLALLNFLAQLTNIIAQNKIGSGFDIATAVYGTQLYYKFGKDVIERNLIENVKEMKYRDISFSKGYNSFLKVHSEREKHIFSFPTGIKLILIDFTIGSDTRILVSKVKKFLDSNKECLEDFLKKSEEFGGYFKNMMEEKNIKREDLLEKNKEYRNVLKEIGINSGTEVEPDIITIILDIISEIKEIIYCISPGAGGYDNSCCLMLESGKLQDIKEIMNIKINNELKVRELCSRNKLITKLPEDILNELKATQIDVYEIKIAHNGVLDYNGPLLSHLIKNVSEIS